MGHPSPMVLWKRRRRPRSHLSPVCSIPLTATCAAALLRRAGRCDLPHRCGHGGCRKRPLQTAHRRRYRFFEFLDASYGLAGGLLSVCMTPSGVCGGSATVLWAAAVPIPLGRTIMARQDLARMGRAMHAGRGGARVGDSVASVNITFFSSHDLRYLFLETEYKDTAFLWQWYTNDCALGVPLP